MRSIVRVILPVVAGLLIVISAAFIYDKIESVFSPAIENAEDNDMLETTILPFVLIAAFALLLQVFSVLPIWNNLMCYSENGKRKLITITLACSTGLAVLIVGLISLEDSKLHLADVITHIAVSTLFQLVYWFSNLMMLYYLDKPKLLAYTNQ